LITPSLNEELFISDLSQYNLNERQIKALFKLYGSENIEFSYESYADCFNISISTSKRDLSDLANKKLVNKKIKNRKTIFYNE